MTLQDPPTVTAAQPRGLLQWLRRSSANRTLLCCAIGALLGLGIAGFSLFTASGTRTSGVPAEDIALVNGVPLLMSDYIEQLRATDNVSLGEASAGQRAQVLKDMIREELYVQRGIELGLQNDSIEVRTALVGAIEAQATIDANIVPPSREALLTLYENHPDRYADPGTMTLTDYVASAEPAPDVLTALRTGGGGSELAKRLGLTSSGAVDDGQEFYFAARLHLGERLFELAAGMRPGQISDPIEVGGQWHVLAVRQNTPPIPAPFETVIDRVRNDYVANEVLRLQSRTEQFLRERADVSIQHGFE